MCKFSKAGPAQPCAGFIDVRPTLLKGCAAVVALAVVLLGGCSVAQTLPAAPRPFGEVESEERGVVAGVHDTMLDLRTGQVRSLRTRSPTIPLGPLAVAVPISIGGEKRRDVPGEEITVRLRSGRLVLVVQELSHPAFALGEEVKILHEKPNLITGESRTRVARVE